MKEGKIIAISNQKGGTAKTTSTFSLGVALAKRGQKVLLVDADLQGELTCRDGLCFGKKIKTSLFDCIYENSMIYSNCINYLAMS